MVLCLILPVLLLGGVSGQITRTCSFIHSEVEDIYVEVEGAGRNLRGMQTHFTKAVVKVANIDNGDDTHRQMMSKSYRDTGETQNNVTSTTTLIPFKGLYCECTHRLPTSSNFYCPVSSKSCEVWRGFSSSDDYSVSCTNENWMVAYARYMWYYLIFWFAFLTISLLLTAPGQHAIKYVLSRRFPSINNRITDIILDLENSRDMQTQMSIAYERHLQRRRDGWVSGYKLKTKRYNIENGEDKGGDDCETLMDADDLNKDANGDGKLKGEAETPGKESSVDIKEDEDVNISELHKAEPSELHQALSSESENNMCTICLLDVEEGDIVADVKCGHVYHADCLSEWILKKNSCPLCQAPDVAEEMRTFETEEEFRRSTSSSTPVNNYPDTFVGRMRMRVHLSAIGNGYSMFGLGGRHYDDDRGPLAPFF